MREEDPADRFDIDADRPEDDPAAELIGRLADVVAALLDVDPAAVSTTDSFADVGLTSAQSVRLTAFLEDRTGVVVAPTAVFDHPSIDALVRFVLAGRPNHPAAPAHSGSEPR